MLEFLRLKRETGYLDELFQTHSKKIAERGRVTAGAPISKAVQEEINAFGKWLTDAREEKIDYMTKQISNMRSPRTGNLYKTDLLNYIGSADVLMHVCEHLLKDFEGEDQDLQ